jgi:hypothetical protein
MTDANGGLTTPMLRLALAGGQVPTVRAVQPARATACPGPPAPAAAMHRVRNV